MLKEETWVQCKQANFPVYRGGNFTAMTRQQSLSTTDSLAPGLNTIYMDGWES